MNQLTLKLTRKLRDAKLAEALVAAGLTTPGRVRRASDEQLLAAKLESKDIAKVRAAL